MGRARWLLIVVTMWLLVACGQDGGVDSAETTPIPPTATHNPTATPTNTPNPPSATPTPTTTATPSPTLTEIPTLTSTPTIEPTQTPTPIDAPIVDLVWAEGVEPITELFGSNFAWSPTMDEIAYLTCVKYGAEGLIYKAAAPNFTLLDITPEDIPLPTCFNSIGVEWRPNGQHLLFNTHAEYDRVNLWVADRLGSMPHLLSEKNRLPWVIQWVNNDQFLYRFYAGGGHTGILVFNLVDKELAGSLPIAWGTHHGIGQNFAAVSIYDPKDFNTPLVIHIPVDWESLRENGIVSSDGFVYDSEVQFPLEHEMVIAHKWIPNTDQLIVQSWVDVEDITQLFSVHELVANMNLDRDIYLWDVASNEATLIVDGVRSISLQPSGELLAVTAATPVTQTQILDIASQSIVDTFESESLIAPQWLNDTHILMDGVIRNVQTGAEMAIIEQPATGYNYSDYAVSQSGEYMSVKECSDGCKTHILKITLP